MIVRYLGIEPQRRAVRAGAVAPFRVFAAGRRYRWSVHRLGEHRSTSRGTSRAETLRVRAPRGASTIALLELRAGSHRYEMPFGVQGAARRRVLLVLPATSWQATNPVEVNGDGYPDVIPDDRSVGIDRMYAEPGRPAAFPVTGALIRYLRAGRLRFDVRTDLELARRGGSSLREYSGVLVAGSDRFAPLGLTRALGSYVEAGGRLAWVGTRGFSRTVELDGGSLVRGRGTRPLGERVRVEPGPRALVVLGDRIDFFRGVGGAFGPFGRIEPSVQLPGRSRLLASAGAEPGSPDIVVYRFESGVVARIGVDGFARSLETDSSAGRIMRRLWDLLSR